MAKWADTKPIKRALSKYEKSLLVEALEDTEYHTRNAVVLPGSPNTEVDELANHFCPPQNISCIEKDPEVADSLYTWYYDTCQVHNDSLFDFLKNSRRMYDYIHMDFCGFLSLEDLQTIVLLNTVMSEDCWVRFSFVRNRKSKAQAQSELECATKTVVPLLRHLNFSEDDIHFVLNYDTALNACIAHTILHMCYDSEFTPIGMRGLKTVERWFYHEPGHPTAMETVWMHFVGCPTNDHQEITTTVALRNLLDAIPSFNDTYSF